MTSPAPTNCTPISTAHLMGISITDLLNMEAGAIQHLQGRLQGAGDAASLDDDPDVTQLITFGIQAAAQIIGALHQARARLHDAELRSLHPTSMTPLQTSPWSSTGRYPNSPPFRWQTLSSGGNGPESAPAPMNNPPRGLTAASRPAHDDSAPETEGAGIGTPERLGR